MSHVEALPLVVDPIQPRRVPRQSRWLQCRHSRHDHTQNTFDGIDDELLPHIGGRLPAKPERRQIPAVFQQPTIVGPPRIASQFGNTRGVVEVVATDPQEKLANALRDGSVVSLCDLSIRASLSKIGPIPFATRWGMSHSLRLESECIRNRW